MNAAVSSRSHTADQPEGAFGDSKDYLTLTIADQLFGIPVLQVQDVLNRQRVNPIPLAPQEVAGSLNLRGRIVTAIDVRCRLGLDKKEGKASDMSVVVEHDGELYSLIIDEVGDVMPLYGNSFENTPLTLDLLWREVAVGVHRLDKKLLIVLDIPKLLDTVHV